MFHVVIAGIRGDQLRLLEQRLPADIQLHPIELRRLLKVRGLRADLVLCTRFMAHKHTLHLERILQTRLLFCPGGVCSWVNVIRQEFMGTRCVSVPRLAS